MPLFGSLGIHISDIRSSLKTKQMTAKNILNLELDAVKGPTILRSTCSRERIPTTSYNAMKSYPFTAEVAVGGNATPSHGVGAKLKNGWLLDQAEKRRFSPYACGKSAQCLA